MTTPVAGRSAAGRLRQFAWASVPIWSLSLLAFVPFLRLATARQRARDWAVFAGYLAASVLVLVLMSIGGPSDTDAVSVAAGTLAIALMGAGAVHAFIEFRPVPGQGGSLTSERALAAARARMHSRQEARELAGSNPVLARDLRIGRPDMLHDYDDGGLVDVNHVPGAVLATSLGLTPAESGSILAARDQLGRFGSAEELSAYAQLSPDRVDALRDWMMFG